MKNNINVRGFIDKKLLEKKELRKSNINNVNGIINLENRLIDIFNIDISCNVMDIKINKFADINLISIMCNLNMDIIGITDGNMGVLLKKQYLFTINEKSLFTDTDYNISLVDGNFKLYENSIIFSLTVLSEYENSKKIYSKSYEESLDLYFDFDKEFI